MSWEELGVASSVGLNSQDNYQRGFASARRIVTNDASYQSHQTQCSKLSLQRSGFVLRGCAAPTLGLIVYNRLLPQGISVGASSCKAYLGRAPTSASRTMHRKDASARTTTHGEPCNPSSQPDQPSQTVMPMVGKAPDLVP